MAVNVWPLQSTPGAARACPACRLGWGERRGHAHNTPLLLHSRDPGGRCNSDEQASPTACAQLRFLPLRPVRAGRWLLSDPRNGKYPSPNLNFKQNCFLG